MKRTQSLDRGKKMRGYRRDGVTHLWYVNPEVQTLEVLCLESGRYALLDTCEGDAVIRAEPFDAVELPHASLWQL